MEQKKWNLQLFADDASAASGGEDAAGENTAPAAGEQDTSFETLIRGRYKKDFDERVQNILSQRLKNVKHLQTQLDTLSPLLSTLANKYGVDSADTQALVSAVQNDDFYYTEAAQQAGVPVEQYRKLLTKQQQEEQGQLAQAQQAAQAAQLARFDEVVAQARKAQELYPALRLDEELQNEDFARLVVNNVPVQTAYEVVHKDDILRGSMAFAAQSAAAKIASAVQSNARRPQEAGIQDRASAQLRVSDPRLLTKQMRQDIRKRVRRGEKIVW